MIKNLILTVLFVILTLVGVVYVLIWQLGIDVLDSSTHSRYTKILHDQGYGQPCKKINAVVKVEDKPDHVFMLCNDLELAYKFDLVDPQHIVVERTHPQPIKDPKLDDICSQCKCECECGEKDTNILSAH